MSAPVTITLPACTSMESPVVESLTAQIQAAGGGAPVVADASAIQNPTAAEITLLVALAREASARGVEFTILHPSQGLVETLRHLRLDREFGLPHGTSP
jgi:hypothetical protein